MGREVAVNPEVSVLIPTYNRSRLLAQCLRSLTEAVAPLAEVIVIDDGSSDDTAAVVAGFDPAVRYERQDNAGKPAAVQHGAQRARGQWLWILDDDDLACPGSIRARLQRLQQTPAAGFVYAPHWVVQTDADGRPLAQRLQVPPEVPGEQLFGTLMRSCFFHLGSCLIRRDDFLALGGLDARLRTGEDYDFQIRLSRRVRGVRCPEPAFEFRQHPGPRGASELAATADARNRALQRDSRSIGLRLRAEVPLTEFDPLAQTPTEQARLRALLHRLLVMSNHGCIPEALEDLCEVIRMTATPQGRRWYRELQGPDLLRRAIGTGWAWNAWAEEEPRARQALRGCAQLAQTVRNRRPLRDYGWGFLRLAKEHPGTPGLRLQRLRSGLNLLLS